MDAAVGQARVLPTSLDDWCIDYWLTTCASKSADTWRSYRREGKRFLAFLAAIHMHDLAINQAELLASASYEDAAKFIAWIETGNEPLPADIAKRYGITPHKPKASPTVLRQAVVILHGLYEELQQAMRPTLANAGSSSRQGQDIEPICKFNPFKPFRRRFSKTSARAASSSASDDGTPVGVSKALSDAAWQEVWVTACHHAPGETQNGSQRARQAAQIGQMAQRRLMLSVIRAIWERRSAAAGLTWSDLRRGQDGVWRMRLKRKGKDLSWEPIPPALLDEIARFRVTVHLPPMPAPEEMSRSIFWAGGRSGRNGPISDDTLYRGIKRLFSETADRMHDAGRFELEAELRRTGLGPHTVRHTMATQFMASGGQPRVAQEILAHSSLDVTTGVYDSRSDREVATALQDQWDRSGTDVVVQRHP